MADKNYTIKNTISFTEFKAIIDFVVEKCFDEFENYDPTYRKFWIRYCLINYYSDFPLYTSDEHNINEIFEQVYGEECDKIITNIVIKNDNQYNDLCEAIMARIEYKLNCLYKTSSYSLTDIAVSSFFDSLKEELSELRGFINKDTIQNLISKVSEEMNYRENKISVSSKDSD